MSSRWCLWCVLCLCVWWRWRGQLPLLSFVLKPMPKRVAPQDIKVNAVHPGLVQTDLLVKVCVCVCCCVIFVLCCNVWSMYVMLRFFFFVLPVSPSSHGAPYSLPLSASLSLSLSLSGIKGQSMTSMFVS